MLSFYLFKIYIEFLICFYILGSWPNLLFFDNACLSLLFVLRIFKSTITLRNVSLGVIQTFRLVYFFNCLIANKQLLRRLITLISNSRALYCCEIFLSLESLKIFYLKSLFILCWSLNCWIAFFILYILLLYLYEIIFSK